MGSLHRTAAVIVLLALTLASRGAEPIAVTHLKWEPGSATGVEARKLSLEEVPAEGLQLPAKVGEQTRFGSIAIGAKRVVHYAFDGETFWLDQNLNLSLADDRSIPVSKAGTRWLQTLSVQRDDTPLALRVYLNANCKRDHLHVQGFAFLRGEVVLAGRLRVVGAIDADSDFAHRAPTDKIRIDLDGNGNYTGSRESIPLGTPFFIRGQAYVASFPDPEGTVLLFHRSDAKPPPSAKPVWRPKTLYLYQSYKKPSESFAELRRSYQAERNGDEDKRDEIVGKVAGLASKEAFRFLLKVTEDDSESTSVRYRTARAMGQKKFAAYAESVARATMNCDNSSVRDDLLYALHWLGYSGREAIYRRVLETVDDYSARAAAQCLVVSGKAELVIQYARKSKSAQVREAAYGALLYHTDPPPAELLKAGMADPEPDVRAEVLAIAEALGLPEARDYALRSVPMVGESWSLANQIATILSREADAESVRALLALTSAVSEYTRKSVLAALRPLRGDGIAAEYVRALKSKDPAVRALAASLLADLPDRKSTDALHKRVKKEKDQDALQSILEAIGHHKDPRSVPTLLSLTRRKDPAVRAAAIRALAEIGPGVPAVRAFFLKLLGSNRWEDRVYALDAAATAEDRSVLKKVVANLDHKHWQVRHAAAQALGSIRARESVLPMILRLEVEDVQRVRAELAKALFVTTGMNLYDFVETWKRWWVEHGKSFKVPDRIPKRRKLDAGGTVASFYGMPLDSGRVIFVIDISGSMSATDTSGGTRLETAIRETQAAVGRLKPRDQVNVILFESAIHPWRKKLVPLNRSNRSSLQKFLARQKPTGGTNLYDGLELALLDKEVDTIFLLSDGSPGSGKYVATGDILRAAGRLNQARRIAIHCVSVGTSSDLLKKLAAANGGEYVQR